jgi:hypothetical protein
MTHELTEKEFRSTFGNQMLDITETIESTVDIWEYVGELYVDEVVSEYVVANELVEKVYRNDSSTFDHVLLPTENPNVFLVIIVDLLNETVLGHFALDMEQKYG